MYVLGWMTVFYRFMCFTSCVGSIARRTVNLVFTLESSVDRLVLGRRTIELRTCACPGRDRRSDEAAARPTILKHDPAVSPGDNETSDCSVDVAPAAETAVHYDGDDDDDDDQIFTLKVSPSYLTVSLPSYSPSCRICYDVGLYVF
jgi:hypothetical protein